MESLHRRLWQCRADWCSQAWIRWFTTVQERSRNFGLRRACLWQEQILASPVELHFQQISGLQSISCYGVMAHSSGSKPWFRQPSCTPGLCNPDRLLLQRTSRRLEWLCYMLGFSCCKVGFWAHRNLSWIPRWCKATGMWSSCWLHRKIIWWTWLRQIDMTCWVTSRCLSSQSHRRCLLMTSGSCRFSNLRVEASQTFAKNMLCIVAYIQTTNMRTHWNNWCLRMRCCCPTLPSQRSQSMSFWASSCATVKTSWCSSSSPSCPQSAQTARRLRPTWTSCVSLSLSKNLRESLRPQRRQCLSQTSKDVWKWPSLWSIHQKTPWLSCLQTACLRTCQPTGFTNLAIWLCFQGWDWSCLSRHLCCSSAHKSCIHTGDLAVRVLRCQKELKDRITPQGNFFQ